MGHHDTKVLVRVNGGRYISVVVTELAKSNNSVSFLGVPKAHELHINIFRICAALNDFRVLAHIVYLSDILQLH